MLRFFKNLARRVTGISTPFGGIQWTPSPERNTDLDKKKIWWLQKFETSYPNIFDADHLCIEAGEEADYIKNMLELEKMGLIQSGILETGTGYVISNPRLTVAGKIYLDSLVSTHSR